MVEKCLAAILQTIRETIRDVISGQSPSTPQPQFSQDNQELNSLPLQLITGASIWQRWFYLTPTIWTWCGKTSRPGSGSKIKAKCFANKFVKFASLLPKSPFDADEKFKWIEKDGQLLFVKSFEAGQKRNFTTWLQAFHVFVGYTAEIIHPS